MATDYHPVLEAIAEAANVSSDQARRLFHGRGQCYHGLEFLTVDAFDPLLWVVLFREPDASEWAAFCQSLKAIAGERWPVAMVQHRYARGASSELLWGELSMPLCAREGSWRFEVQPGTRQNIGYFMDMSPGRDWLSDKVEGRKVLNLFAYTCAFSVAAIGYGAREVVNVDMSRASLQQGRQNHRLNRQADALDRVSFLPYNLFRSWKRIREQGPYDVIVIDPPSRQKGSFEAEKDYQRVLRRLPELANAGADILACLNAPYLESDFLHRLFDEACPQATFVERLANRSDFPDSSPESSLKMLHYHWPISYLR